MICKKKKIDKIKAMMIIANSQKESQKSRKRKEKKYYWCNVCKSYHTTSKNKY